MKRLIDMLPITRMKILVAGILYRAVRLVIRDDKRTIVRNGIKYDIDLSEGLDLSIFLFGNFQKHVSQNKRLSLPDDAVIFDVGANVGIMTLPFAKSVARGKVYSFEPTHYAVSKLKRNLQLNPALASRVVVVQTFVSAADSPQPDITAYASWKVNGSGTDDKHAIHGGRPKSTEGIGAVSLDGFTEKNGITRLDFIKIDTDGHELEVLQGAAKLIRKFNPAIIFELGMYVMRERDIEFSDYLSYFDSVDYALFNSRNFKRIDATNYRRHIPAKATIDILAMPKERCEDY